MIYEIITLLLYRIDINWPKADAGKLHTRIGLRQLGATTEPIRPSPQDPPVPFLHEIIISEGKVSIPPGCLQHSENPREAQS